MTQSRWTVDRAHAWHAEHPWLVGCNYVTSTAVNSVAMWQPRTFDTDTIARELGWAKAIGFNAVRVVLQVAVWEDDPNGFLKRFGQFMDIARSTNLLVVPVLFDDVAVGDTETVLGVQPDPIDGVYNSRWTPGPGHARVADESSWAALQEYVTMIVGAFRADDRVIMWDVYNEPGHGELADTSLGLLRNAFEWCRQADPTQPITAGIWEHGVSEGVRNCIIENSDVITFQLYGDRESTNRVITNLQALERPVICTGWLARTQGSGFQSNLAVFQSNNVGNFCAGFVNGATQRHLTPGESSIGAGGWYQDILRSDGYPYDEIEIEMLRHYIRALDWIAPEPASSKRPRMDVNVKDVPLKVGVVGLGFGLSYMKSFMEIDPDADMLDVRAVCDLNRERLTRGAELFQCERFVDYERMLRDAEIDAVALFTGPIDRADLIRRAIQAGKHVMTTSPMELDPKSAESVLSEAVRLKRVVHLNSPPPMFEPDFEQVANWIMEYDLGAPIAFQASVWSNLGAEESSDTGGAPSWVESPHTCPVAPIFRLGIFAINDALRLMGFVDKVNVVHNRSNKDAKTPESGLLTLQFKNGAIGSIFGSQIVDDGRKSHLTEQWNYERGTITRTIDEQAESGVGQSVLTLNVGSIDGRDPVSKRKVIAIDEIAEYQWDVFRQAIRRRIVGDVMTTDQIVEGIKVIAAMAKAEETGRWQSV